MDTAFALVQAYLVVNGYFTVVEYPLLEVGHAGHVKTVTDIDILAHRFPGAGPTSSPTTAISRSREPHSPSTPCWGCPSDRRDMIVGEVKEGRAQLNPPLRDPAVVEVALTRFGCCPAEHAPYVTRHLLSRGHAITPAGHAIRLVAFGDSTEGGSHGPWTTVPMAHVVQYLQQHLPAHWSALRHAQVRDPAFAVLALLENWSVQPTGDAQPRRTREP
jgi:hypothetical protein